MSKTSVQLDLLICEPTKSRAGYRVAKDSMNWILQAGTYPDPKHLRTKDPDRVRWKDIGYYQSVAGLIRGYHQRVALASERTLPESLNEATEAASKLLDRVKSGLIVEVQA